MPDTSPRLSLPYLQAAQAQKHVTHNEALQRLDILVQMQVQAFEATTPPPVPAEGDIYALGTGTTGDWAGQDGLIAAFMNGVWLFVAPQAGWHAEAADGSGGRVWRAGNWQDALANIDQLGINTSADAINRLAVAADAALFTHDGNGHQIKINKAASTDTASLIYQTGWSGRAEMGLAGDDDFTIKVSPDGTSWTTAMTFDRTTGMAGGVAVQTDTSDDTAGRLMTVGAFGLGGNALTLGSGDDLNALATTGFYYNPTAGNTPGNNYPISSAGSLLNLHRTSTNWTQTYTAYHSNRVFSRAYGTSGWSPWSEIFHQGSLLGSVSQSGGVPTGAVIERGSNANGEYVRFADGTQICVSPVFTADATSAVGSLYRWAANQTWTYPASFITVPNAVPAHTNNNSLITTVAQANSTAVNINVLNSVSTTAREARAVATGRWF